MKPNGILPNLRYTHLSLEWYGPEWIHSDLELSLFGLKLAPDRLGSRLDLSFLCSWVRSSRLKWTLV